MQSITNDFEAFMGKNGTKYNQFYVGITSDLNGRLSSGHGIDNTVPCIWSNNPMPSDTIHAIEKFFLNKGTRGGPGGGDNNIRYIYAYLIGPRTRQ